MTRLAVSNLFHRKTRTALSVLAVSAEIAFFLVLVGISTGTIRESGDRIENVNADVLLLPPGSQLVLGMSTAVMPLEPVRALLEAAPGVLTAAPVTFATTNAFGGYGLVFGIDSSYQLAGRGGLELMAGRTIEGNKDLLVDERLARAHDLSIGQEVQLLNHQFEIVGIVRSGAGVRMYLPIGTVQDLLGRRGKASLFFIRVRDKDKVQPVLDHLRASPALKGYKVFASARYTELLGSSTIFLREFHAAVTVIAVGFGFIVILLSMYTMSLERTRQIGILKSLGADKSFIVREMMLEAILLAGVGIPLGFGAALVFKQLLLSAYPTLNILFTAGWAVMAIAIALTSGILGALYPAWRAASVDPVDALAWE